MLLFRYLYASECTMGILFCGRGVYYTLEPPWRGNERNKSCIPKGDYSYSFMSRSASGKYKNCYHIKDVPGRSEILIHTGNTPDHTLGCVLVGMKAGMLANKRAVLSSRIALSDLNSEAPERGKLRVV